MPTPPTRPPATQTAAAPHPRPPALVLNTPPAAAQVGARMGAWRVILTHFSQRYPKLADVRGAPTDGAVIAFDMMAVPFPMLTELPRVTPALQCLFASEMAD